METEDFKNGYSIGYERAMERANRQNQYEYQRGYSHGYSDGRNSMMSYIIQQELLTVRPIIIKLDKKGEPMKSEQLDKQLVSEITQAFSEAVAKLSRAEYYVTPWNEEFLKPVDEKKGEP